MITTSQADNTPSAAYDGQTIEESPFRTRSQEMRIFYLPCSLAGFSAITSRLDPNGINQLLLCLFQQGHSPIHLGTFRIHKTARN
jgi:hypothetical protein